MRKLLALVSLALAGCTVQVVSTTRATPASPAVKTSPSQTPPVQTVSDRPTSGLWELSPGGRQVLRFEPDGSVLRLVEREVNGGAGAKVGTWDGGKVSWGLNYGEGSDGFSFDETSTTQLVGTKRSRDDTGLDLSAPVTARFVEPQEIFQPQDGTWEFVVKRGSETITWRAKLTFGPEGAVKRQDGSNEGLYEQWGGHAVQLSLPFEACSPAPCGPNEHGNSYYLHFASPTSVDVQLTEDAGNRNPHVNETVTGQRVGD